MRGIPLSLMLAAALAGAGEGVAQSPGHSDTEAWMKGLSVGRYFVDGVYPVYAVEIGLARRSAAEPD
ncbi:MAG TPA: hypothetical protein VF212_10975 [Longimicrobiales bacterium]